MLKSAQMARSAYRAGLRAWFARKTWLADKNLWQLGGFNQSIQRWHERHRTSK